MGLCPEPSARSRGERAVLPCPLQEQQHRADGCEQVPLGRAAGVAPGLASAECETVPHGGSGLPPVGGWTLSELILVPQLTAGDGLLYRFGGALLHFLGLLLGEVHLF